MELNEEKSVLSLNNAKKALQTADHLVYVTFPMLGEQRLLLKSLEELKEAIISIINAILQYESYHKKISIQSDAQENFENFKKISFYYSISPEQIKKIMEILKIAEEHKKSPFEFVKNDKIIIMGTNSNTEILSIEKIKNYIIEVKDFLRKARIKMKVL
jgi:hypothetical protein